MKNNAVSVSITEKDFAILTQHLFPGDFGEHGAVLTVGKAEQQGKKRLLVQRVFCAEDGIDYVVGRDGYHQLRAEFIADCLAYCRDEDLSYLAVHNHGGSDTVAFSTVDLLSHERGYPTLLSLLPGDAIVGALVFARNSCAGDIWHSTGHRSQVVCLDVIGATHKRLTPAPTECVSPGAPRYSRQVLMFGKRGQAHLAGVRVGVIGLGGVGSIVVELLARLGVGFLVLIDPDRVEASNLSRLCGADEWDARLPLQNRRLPGRVRRWASRRGTFKIELAARIARRAQSKIDLELWTRSVASPEAARACQACDFLFLAADSMQSRLIFNAIVHQYLIPGIQIGSKVVVDPETQAFLDAYSAIRWVRPGDGCLWCNGLISPHGLALEAKSTEEREAQAYGLSTPNPSVMSLNAIGASIAVNEFLFQQLGLKNQDTGDQWQRIHHPSGEIRHDLPRRDPHCPECVGRFAHGDARTLPTLLAT